MPGDDVDTPPIRFARARGARIAYQDFGAGDHTVVAVPPLAQNIELAWDWPDIRAMLTRQAEFARMIVFDKRGTGSSDRTSRVPGLDERVDDLRAVFDAAGVDRGHLYGASGGGPTALMFAATYPDRVASVTLHSSGARTTTTELTAEVIEQQRRRADEFCALWGTPGSRMLELFAPSVAHDQRFRRWHERYERLSASADSLRELMAINLELDVRGVLGRVTAPVLVLHARGDRVVPVELGREAAAAIKGAMLFEYDGIDHLQYVGDLDLWMPVFERFVTGKVKDRRGVVPRRRTVNITTLGRFVVTVDGVEVPTVAWGSRLARQLCKRLVIARGWPVTRDELVELLWPGETDVTRLGARLSVQLSSVRKVLRGGVSADRESVALDLDEVSTDLEIFHGARTDEAIVKAFTGPFLPGEVYEDWASATRDEVSTRFVGAAHRLASTAMEQRDHQRAVELGRRIIQADSYDETAHRLVVTALHAAGVTGAARRAHARWVEVMAEIEVEVGDFESVISP